MILIAVIFKFGFAELGYDGAGALAALCMAAVAAQFWQAGKGIFSAGPNEHASHEAEHYLCIVWSLLSEPLLFGVIGSALDFKTIEASTVPKALLLLSGCVTVRTIVAFLATYGC